MRVIMEGKTSWADRDKIYAIKMTSKDRAYSLALFVDSELHDFKGICYLIPGEHGHMLRGHLGRRTDRGFTFISEGHDPGEWEFIEVTYDNFKEEYHRIVAEGERILEEVSSTQELIDWYHRSFG